MPLCIVPCGRKKIWDKEPHRGRAPAREAYIGQFAKTCIRYAEHFYPHSYRILSARYGFLKPEQEIENYNITFKDTEAITIENLINQAREQGLLKYDTIIILGGFLYRNIAQKAFSRAANITGLPLPQIITPLQGMGIGQMIKTMKEAINKNIQLE
ncbi:MAG: DUF6884 domain-containing protein [Thermodesulfovibrionales bacterium]